MIAHAEHPRDAVYTPRVTRPRWILDLHPEFPGSAVVRSVVEDPVIVDASDVLLGRWPDVEDPIVGYGTMRTMTRMARHPSLRDAVFDDYGKLRCSSYYRHLYELLGRVCVLVPFDALPRLPLARMFGEHVFVRSDTNYKLFPAQLLAVEDVARWLTTYIEHRHELVVISEAVTFDVEYRCFCRNGRIVCGSSYPTEPYRPVPEDVRRFAEGAAQTLLREEGLNMVTVDVGIGDGKLRLVEIGGVNSWGIYGSDVHAFVAAMEAEAIARWTDAA